MAETRTLIDERLRRLAAIRIDAGRPLDEVVDDLVARTAAIRGPG
jgi:hypothetical protein